MSKPAHDLVAVIGVIGAPGNFGQSSFQFFKIMELRCMFELAEMLVIPNQINVFAMGPGVSWSAVIGMTP